MYFEDSLKEPGKGHDEIKIATFFAQWFRVSPGYPPPLPDYTAVALLAFFLFFLGYFPGLVYTVFKLVDALQYSAYYKQVYGRRPAGIGCLQSLLIVGIFAPVVVVSLLVIGLYYAFPHR